MANCRYLNRLHIEKGNTDIWWHNGGTAGYTSSMGLNPSRKNGIVILTNISGFHPKNEIVDELCFELLEAI